MNINGTRAELKFGDWLLERRYEVFYPCGPGGTADIVWRAGPGEPWRSAQVKKPYYRAGEKVPSVKLRRSDGGKYAPGDADYFACVDYEQGYLWMIPLHEACMYGDLRLQKDWLRFRRGL